MKHGNFRRWQNASKCESVVRASCVRCACVVFFVHSSCGALSVGLRASYFGVATTPPLSGAFARLLSCERNQIPGASAPRARVLRSEVVALRAAQCWRKCSACAVSASTSRWRAGAAVARAADRLRQSAPASDVGTTAQAGLARRRPHVDRQPVCRSAEGGAPRSDSLRSVSSTTVGLCVSCSRRTTRTMSTCATSAPLRP